MCIFGCPRARDDIAHYATCPQLWRVSCEAAGSSLPSCVEEQLLLLSPTCQRLEALVVAFSVYHAVKLGHTAAVDRAQKTNSYDEIQSLMVVEAKAHAIKFGIGQGVVSPSRHPARDTANSPARSGPVLDSSAPSRGIDIGTRNHFQRSGHLTRDEVFEGRTPTVAEVACGWSASDASRDGSRNSLPDPRAFCEPECSDLPAGEHHPCCSAAILMITSETSRSHRKSPL